MEAWLIIAVVLAILYLWWVFFRWTFGLIDRALEHARAEQRAEDLSATREKVS